MSSIWLIAGAAFVGSFHCVAMCGPFVAFYSLNLRPVGWRHHLGYQLGRLIAYLSLGAVVGWVGQGLFALSSTLSLQRALAIGLGIMMMLLGFSHVVGRRTRIFAKPGQWMSRLIGKKTQSATPFLIGLLSTLLPCGYLYAFAFAAGASGHPISAIFAMVVFWLGTLPALLAVAVGSQWTNPSIWRHLERLTPLFLILFGVLAVTGKWLNFPDLQNSFEVLCRQIAP